MTKINKTKLIEKSKIHDTDTGSPEVQVSILSAKIDKLADHLKKNHKDNHSRRGLLQMVADRRSHLSYLKKKSSDRYEKITKKLGLKTK